MTRFGMTYAAVDGSVDGCQTLWCVSVRLECWSGECRYGRCAGHNGGEAVYTVCFVGTLRPTEFLLFLLPLEIGFPSGFFFEDFWTALAPSFVGLPISCESFD